MNKFALALRSELYTTREITDFARLADESNEISHVFFPDIPSGLESIELSAASLAMTERVRIGSGVLRPLEHDPKILARRLVTIQSLCGNRFVLGIGVGSPGPSPGETVRRMFAQLEDTKKIFESSSHNLNLKFPEVFVAALREGMARRSIKHADGLLLNFCSPQHAKRLTSQLADSTSKSENGDHSSSSSGKVTLACYVKIFFAKDQQRADRLLIEEFVKYDSFPQYHKMFEEDGVASLIKETREQLSTTEGEYKIPSRLQEISLSNPNKDELREMLEEFRRAGIGLPCVYPYFVADEDRGYKTNVIKMIIESLKS
jgi:alkanesulfonate monooxygenase SsuD/methylene tetrahydromethanopterin reductase-like flavin-dependent oxidoreductase (luciferase family)